MHLSAARQRGLHRLAEEERQGVFERVVYEVVRRTISAEGQALLIPDIEVQTWWSNLAAAPEDVIRLYREHSTCEQFHAELKTDMDLERLPSGKFATNALVLLLAMMAYNALRLCGQTSLREARRLPAEKHVTFRKKADRRRLRTVILDLMYQAVAGSAMGAVSASASGVSTPGSMSGDGPT